MLQFRAEAFNFTNTPQFNNPSSNVSNMTLNKDGTIANVNNFMAITSTYSQSSGLGTERKFRFALRLTF
jgi:hypothetical protein